MSIYKLPGSAIQANTVTTNQLASNISPTDRVLKTGDTMTGQLNIADGGLIVQADNSEAAVFVRSPTATFRLRPYYNEEGSNKGTWLETITTTGASYSKFTLSASDIVFEPTGNVGIGSTNLSAKLTVAGTIYTTTGGVKFPDGTVQTTAASGSGGFAKSFLIGL